MPKRSFPHSWCEFSRLRESWGWFCRYLSLRLPVIKPFHCRFHYISCRENYFLLDHLDQTLSLCTRFFFIVENILPFILPCVVCICDFVVYTLPFCLLQNMPCHWIYTVFFVFCFSCIIFLLKMNE